jgi:LAO/AO transport system kinase
VGVTGSPGAGKSTLVSALVQAFRAEGSRVGVVAVDPSSPFSGGAILGDRIRMQAHVSDPDVFIRSVAARGALGGLSRSTADLACVLGAWGAKVVLIETVGVGQSELEVARSAHTTLVVVAPGMGDEVQALKAGVLEVADVLVVNKADREGAETTAHDLESTITLGIADAGTAGASAARRHSVAAFRGGARGEVGFLPKVVRTVATRGEGVAELVEAMRAHRIWLESTSEGQARWRARVHQRLVRALRERVADRALERLRSLIDAAAARVESGAVDPYTACDELMLELESRD